ncbi:MAG: response regulator [Planctomycetota bacterium]|nr:response regulator [Planctomycetota bacterium]
MDKTQQPLVLVVDDETDVLGEVASVLGKSGYNCHCCENPKSAMEFVDSNQPDLIISDINLEGHSGLEMCERIKENEALKDVPVMFLSGAQIPDIIRRSHAVGGTYYLRKPFDPEVLMELVDKALWMPHLVHSHEQAAGVRV